MKTNYPDLLDQEYLRKALSFALMQTERIFDDLYLTMPELSEYWYQMLNLRAKLYEFLGEEDPNEYVLEFYKQKRIRADLAYKDGNYDHEFKGS